MCVVNKIYVTKHKQAGEAMRCAMQILNANKNPKKCPKASLTISIIYSTRRWPTLCASGQMDGLLSAPQPLLGPSPRISV